MNLLRKILKWLFVGPTSLVLLALIFGRIYQTISETRDLSRCPGPGKRIAVDGHLMHIHCIGQGSPTVIFERGVGSVAASWDYVHRQTAQLTRSCAHDRAGLGYSEPNTQPARSTDVAQRLHKLLLGAKIDDKLVLVGWLVSGRRIRSRVYPPIP